MYSILKGVPCLIFTAEVKQMRIDKKAFTAVFTALSPLWLFAAMTAVYGLSLCALSISATAAVLCALSPALIWSALCVYLTCKKQIKSRHFIALVLLFAIAVRVCYILTTDWNERQHDVFAFDTQGHAGYIYTLMKTGSLPNSNNGLFYHPPLHHYIMSLAGRLLSGIINSTGQVFEALQLLPAYYSLMCGVVFLKILNIFNIRQSTRLLFFAFFTLHPSLIVFSGSINNDILCLLLSMCTVLYLLRFFHIQSLKNAVLTGLFLGLAMMTKVSAVTIAPVIAVVFVIRLVKPCENVSRKKVFVRELSFAAVSIPLGMWYPIRNLLKFGQPLGYVMPIGTEHPLYCGNRSITERFLLLSVKDLFKNTYCIPESDYNIPTYTVKCSLFGEFSFDFPKWAVCLLIALNCLIIIFCIFSIIYAVKKRNPNGLLLSGISIVTVLFFIYFNIKYPNGCSMDFRYISLCLCSSTATAALCFDGITEKCRRLQRSLAAAPFIAFSLLALCLYLSGKL